MAAGVQFFGRWQYVDVWIAIEFAILSFRPDETVMPLHMREDEQGYYAF
jgi:hypothetical protein